MKIPSPSHRRRARIEIIPLIDIVFFLLATFVMVSMSMVNNQGVPVRVPHAASGVSQGRDASVTISVLADGAFYIDKKSMSLTELVQHLRAVKKKRPATAIIINGDESARLGQVVKVLDKLRYIGFEKVSIRTRK
ncbi:biopolymer transporter ExbD [bacterium]|nr:biopolymer transporter ExbD [bacterium]